MAFRILVHDTSAKVRSDLKAMLTPAGEPAEALGADSLSVLLEGAHSSGDHAMRHVVNPSVREDLFRVEVNSGGEGEWHFLFLGSV